MGNDTCGDPRDYNAEELDGDSHVYLENNTEIFVQPAGRCIGLDTVWECAEK